MLFSEYVEELRKIYKAYGDSWVLRRVVWKAP